MIEKQNIKEIAFFSKEYRENIQIVVTGLGNFILKPIRCYIHIKNKKKYYCHESEIVEIITYNKKFKNKIVVYDGSEYCKCEGVRLAWLTNPATCERCGLKIKG